LTEKAKKTALKGIVSLAFSKTLNPAVIPIVLNQEGSHEGSIDETHSQQRFQRLVIFGFFAQFLLIARRASSWNPFSGESVPPTSFFGEAGTLTEHHP
jgi:hypothetical protein